MAVRRLRLGANSPRQLGRPKWALQAANFWLFLALLAAASLAGTLAVWRVFAPDAYSVTVVVFWVGLAATATLTAFPRPRISVGTNVLVALASIFLAAQLVRIHEAPKDAVRIGVPFTEQWLVASGGRSTLLNSHWSLTVQQNAIDLMQLVDGETYRGDKSRLENYYIFGDPLLAVADGQVTAAVGHARTAGRRSHLGRDGGKPRDPGHRRRALRHVRPHEAGSLRVQVGDYVRRGKSSAR